MSATMITDKQIEAGAKHLFTMKCDEKAYELMNADNASSIDWSDPRMPKWDEWRLALRATAHGVLRAAERSPK